LGTQQKRIQIWLLVAIISVCLASCATMTSYQARSEYDTGLSLFNRGLFSDAIPHFEKATEIDPDFAMAYLYLGRSYVSTGSYTKAISPLRTAYRLSPDNVKNQILDILLDALFNAVPSEVKKQKEGS
jgi:tetratricopeptide (TPR) repeat protein